MMHLRWLLLVFVLNFVFDPIKARHINRYRWYVAKTTFDYLKTNEEGMDEIIPHNDYMLMVAVDDNHIVGPGQVQCRHINPPIEQIVNIAATTEYFPYDDLDLIETKAYFTYPKQCYQDTYGCITLVHNFCHIENHDVPADFNNKLRNAVLRKNSVKPIVNDSLLAFFLQNADGSKLNVKYVKVVDFEECKKLFDPDNVYLVDPEEQLCTERVRPELGDDPIALPSAMLIHKFKEGGFELVGIESKAKEGLSLSTWIPYHCRHENVPCQ